MAERYSAPNFDQYGRGDQ